MNEQGPAATEQREGGLPKVSVEWVWRMLRWALGCEQREQTGHHNGDKDQTVVRLLQALFSIRPGVPPPSCPY